MPSSLERPISLTSMLESYKLEEEIIREGGSYLGQVGSENQPYDKNMNFLIPKSFNINNYPKSYASIKKRRL